MREAGPAPIFVRLFAAAVGGALGKRLDSRDCAFVLIFHTKIGISDVVVIAVEFGHRFYNPDSGRWLNRDPIGEAGGLNLQAFVRNSTIDLFDPLGLSELIGFPAQLPFWIESGWTVSEIANMLGTSVAAVAAMVAAYEMEKAVEKIIDNLKKTAKGKDPCEKAKAAVKAAQKSLKSFQKLIDKHQGYINNPSSYPGGLQPPYDTNPQLAIDAWLRDIAKAQKNIDKYNKALKVLQKAADAACKCWYKPWTWF